MASPLPSWRELHVERLRTIAACEGIDFATRLLYERLIASDEHGPFIRSLDALRPPSRLELTIALVPGACYVEYPHTGADGRVLRDMARGWGCRVETIPVKSFGSLEENACRVRDWLTAYTGEPLVLVSLSKGGADVRTALAAINAENVFGKVAAWVNLSGIVWGTPLVSWVTARRWQRSLVRLLCWYRGYDFSTFRTLDHRNGPLTSDWRLPDGLRVIHVLGFPLREHLSSRQARRGHCRLASWGPNDGGGILLGDVGRLPGHIYPLWGADHYMRPAWDIRPLIGRILLYARDAAAALVP